MSGPIVPVGGGVPVDPETGERYGYLPRKAASRKLIIRAQLGLPWVLAALAAAAVLAVAAAVFVLSRPDRPGKPYVDEGALRGYPEQAVQPLRDRSGWLDRRTGLAAVAGPVAFCPADGGWVGEGGKRYDAEGRADDGRGLALWAVKAASGHVYVDPTRTVVISGQTEPLPPCAQPWHVTDPAPPDGL
ncbi:MAG: hypothetical protein QOE45_3107 [Frankiaceae bacterium]|nr:hypothetical protein [Frankiaceae bacterium]